MTECGTDSPMEHVLSGEDAECCICLSAYEDGAELRQLPCGHHFHCTCVDKWLYINATCPLCKYNILKSTSQDREEVQKDCKYFINLWTLSCRSSSSMPLDQYELSLLSLWQVFCWLWANFCSWFGLRMCMCIMLLPSTFEY